MRVIFRVDAAVSLGTGHVVRCATLAEALRRQNAEIAFICADSPGNMNAWLREKNFQVFELPAERAREADATLEVLNAQPARPDWLVVDHYFLDETWESRLRSTVEKIFAIDDLADRPHACELLLDQNYYRNPTARYEGLVPTHCRLLLGPEYALLRSEFGEARSRITRGQSPTLNLLIFFGGSDPTGETPKALEAVRLLPDAVPIEVEVVVGASNPERECIRDLCAAMPVKTRFHCQVNTMAKLMARADITIGAGGTTTWERLCVGLPSIVLAVADNQVELSTDLANDGYEIFLGPSRNISAAELSEQLQALINNPKQRQHFETEGMKLVDGRGVRRIVQALMHPVSPGLS